MPRIPKNSYQRIYNVVCDQFIPTSECEESNCACYVLYDWHPRDDKKIDITICSDQGHVQEFYKRNLVSSIKILNGGNFKHIRILRNSKGDLFYLVATESEVIILSRKEKLVIHERISNVRDYEVLDQECTGEPKLKIVMSDRNVSSQHRVMILSVDNNFKNVDEDINSARLLEDSKPVIYELQKKLNEATYNLHVNENALKNIIKLRQLASYSSHETDAFTKEILKPTVLFCNKKIVLLIRLENPYAEPIGKVCTFIHNNGCDSISYTTKLFEILPASSFYEENKNQEIKANDTAIIAVVIPIKEFKSSLNSRIEFNLVVFYERLVAGEPPGKQLKNYLHLCRNIEISTFEVMGKYFDLFDCDLSKQDDLWKDHLILSTLAATEKTTLYVKEIITKDCTKVDLSYIFCNYLNMVFIDNDKVAILKHSPYHILYGIMIFFHDIVEDNDFSEFNFKIDVYARSPLQVLALIHFIYDSIPHKLMVTTPSIQMKSKALSQDYDENMNNDSPLDYTHCTSSLIKQSEITLQYFDECLKNMNTNAESKHQFDNQIDIFAMGYDKYIEYRNKMLTEAKNGIALLNKKTSNKTETDIPIYTQDSDCVLMEIE